MSLAKVHLWTTYAMVLTSFLAVATSGELSAAITVPVGLLLLASTFWDSPRISFTTWAPRWTALSLVFFLGCLARLFMGADILLTGVQFLTYLLMVKCFQRQSSKDYLQLYALTFLMFVAGTVLQAELTYGLLFFVYALSATWALSLFHLRRSAEEKFGVTAAGANRVRLSEVLHSTTLVSRTFFTGTAMLSVVVFASSVIIFLAIPRIGFGFFFKNARPETAMAGFSDGVTLGGHGLIKSDDRVVVRIKVDPTFIDEDAPNLHWRGVAFDLYKDGQWRRSKRAPKTRRAVDFNQDATAHHLLYTEREPTKAELRRRRQDSFKQEIYLEPMGYDVLFGASMPIAFEFESRFKEETRVGQNDEIRHPHAQGIKYTVYSDLNPPSEQALEQSTLDAIPESFGPYLTLPDDVSERTVDLAAQIAADHDTPYAQARALENWLQTELGYTLAMEEPGELEPIDFFIFERKKGHCEYFASSLAIMARTLGIPSRSVNGFYGGVWNEFDKYIALRAGDAHSWVELYFPDVGWVTFDPTPSGGRNSLRSETAGLLQRVKRWTDSLRFAWFRWVIEYDLYRQLRFLKKLQKMFTGPKDRESVRESPEAKKSPAPTQGSRAKYIGLIVLAALAIGLVTYLRQRQRRVGPDRRSSDIAKRYRRVLRAYAKRGHLRADEQTPRRHAEELVARRVPGAEHLAELVALYNSHEYGARSANMARVDRLATSIVRQLKSRPS